MSILANQQYHTGCGETVEHVSHYPHRKDRLSEWGDKGLVITETISLRQEPQRKYMLQMDTINPEMRFNIIEDGKVLNETVLPREILDHMKVMVREIDARRAGR